MSTRQILFALLACVAFGYAGILSPARPEVIACEGKSLYDPCKVTLAGVEVDGTCEVTLWRVG
jgi:hypothetical protein